MTVQLKPEQEQIIGQAIQAGLIANANDVVDAGIDAIRRRLQLRESETVHPVLSAEQWEHEFDSWIKEFPNTAPLPDEALSRENLYPDRA
ncbi:MAG: hypothetical protein JWP63_2429 [Candidatus Solibacter sp.]|nr:hypothetical protein [Candidatus Solibacter sp.]